MIDRPLSLRRLALALTAALLGLPPTACTTTSGATSNGATAGNQSGTATGNTTVIKGGGHQPPPGLAFSYILDAGRGTPAMQHCLIRFTLLGATAPVAVETQLLPTANRVLVKVPAGTYRLTEASCDNGRRFTVTVPGDFLVPDDETVTFLGRLRLTQAQSSLKPGHHKEVDRLSLEGRLDADNERTYGELQSRGLKVSWPTRGR